MGYFAHLFAEEKTEEARTQTEEEEASAPVRIGTLNQAIRKKKVKKAAPVQVAKEDAIPLKQVTREEALKVLGGYAQELKKNGKRALAAFLADPMLEVKDGVLEFIVGSKTLERDISEHWPILLSRMKETGSTAELSVLLDPKKVQEYKLFTPQEQFDALCKEYPKLKEFKERFGLDLEV